MVLLIISAPRGGPENPQNRPNSHPPKYSGLGHGPVRQEPNPGVALHPTYVKKIVSAETGGRLVMIKEQKEKKTKIKRK